MTGYDACDKRVDDRGSSIAIAAGTGSGIAKDSGRSLRGCHRPGASGDIRVGVSMRRTLGLPVTGPTATEHWTLPATRSIFMLSPKRDLTGFGLSQIKPPRYPQEAGGTSWHGVDLHRVRNGAPTQQQLRSAAASKEPLTGCRLPGAASSCFQ